MDDYSQEYNDDEHEKQQAAPNLLPPPMRDLFRALHAELRRRQLALGEEAYLLDIRYTQITEELLAIEGPCRVVSRALMVGDTGIPK